MSAVLTSPVSPATSDSSVRLPVLMFFGGAVFWLVAGAFLALVSAWKLVHPEFFDGISWLTYGRLQPAADNILLYGWASQAAIGTGLWLLARLGRTVLPGATLLVVAAVFWNLGVLAGVFGIVAGYGTALETLDFPGFAVIILFGAFACIGLWSLRLLRDRTSSGLYVSQWYLLAAFLWFPWFYATATTLLVFNPIQGSAQTPILWWFSNNLIWLWLAPVVLATAYFIIPQEEGRPVRAYSWSILAFWGIALLGGWSGTRSLIGGPVPAWLVSAGVAASILLIIPVTLVGINTFGTMSGPAKSAPMQFLVVSLWAMALSVAANAATPLVTAVTHFSDYGIGLNLLVVLGFISFGLFAAVHYITPRLLGETFCPVGSGWHFWLMVIGVSTMVGSLLLGGLIQGFALADPGVTFQTSLNLAFPFRFLRAVGNLIFLAGAAAFALLFLDALLRKADVLPMPRKKGASV
jgi:cytochrome c oxidase cbb3-type subunit I